MLMSDASSAGFLAPTIADLMAAMQAMERKINVMQTEIHVGVMNR